jgi:hypothetical protein
MNRVALVDHVRAEAEADDSPEQRAQRIADLVRTRTGRRWSASTESTRTRS